MDFEYGYNVLECRHFVAPSSLKKIERTVKDYEFDFYLKGERTMYIDDKKYTINANDAVFRMPGQRVYSYGDYDCYILTLDFANKKTEGSYSRNLPGNIQKHSEHVILKNIPPVFSLIHSNGLFYALEHLSLQYDLNDDFSKSLVWEILCLVNSDIRRAYNRTKTNSEGIAADVRNYIDKNYHSHITLDLLSHKFNINKYHLVRIFKNKYFCTPIDYAVNVRLLNARELLMTTDMTIKEIAVMCGYSDESYFIKKYGKKYGLSPQKFRLKTQ